MAATNRWNSLGALVMRKVPAPKAADWASAALASFAASLPWAAADALLVITGVSVAPESDVACAEKAACAEEGAALPADGAD